MNLPLLLRAYVFLGLIEAGIAMGGILPLSPCTGMDLGHAARMVRLRLQRRRPPLPSPASSSPRSRTSLPAAQTVCRSLDSAGSAIRSSSGESSTELVILALHHLYPLGNEIFRTSPLPAWIFGPLVLGALVLLFAEESRKIIVNRFTNSRAGKVTQQAGTS